MGGDYSRKIFSDVAQRSQGRRCFAQSTLRGKVAANLVLDGVF